MQINKSEVAGINTATIWESLTHGCKNQIPGNLKWILYAEKF